MHILFGIWLTLAAGDATTTHMALNRGAHEVMLTQNPWANDFIVGGEAAGVTVGARALEKTGHRKAAITLLVVASAVRGYAVVNNLRVLRQQR